MFEFSLMKRMKNKMLISFPVRKGVDQATFSHQRSSSDEF